MLDKNVTTVSKEYANALISFAVESKEIELIQNNLRVLVNAIEQNLDFMKIISSKTIEAEEKKQVIKTIINSDKDYFLHFLYVLLDNGRFDQIASISLAYDELVLDYFNKMVVDVYTKYQLTNEQKIKLVSRLQTKFNKTIIIKEHIDNTLLGGVKIVSNNKIYDYSIDSQLDQLKENIMKG